MPVPTTNIVPSDIGKRLKVLVRGRFLVADIITHHRSGYVVYVIDTGRYENVNLKHDEDKEYEQTSD